MCLDDQVLSTYIDGELAEPWKTQVEAHLLHCTSCKARYDQLLDLERDLKAARLREEEFSVQQERVWQYLEKKCVAAVRDKFSEKRFTIKAPVLVAAAAAFVIFFAAGIFLATQGTANTINEIPVAESAEESVPSPIIPVSATDSAPAASSLKDLTIEEILQLLDERGFEVDLRLKSVEPLKTSAPVSSEAPDTAASAAAVEGEGAAGTVLLYDMHGNPILIRERLADGMLQTGNGTARIDLTTIPIIEESQEESSTE